MMQNDPQQDIFEEVRVAAGCDYLSDLYTTTFAGAVKQAISEIPDDKYTLDEWSRLAGYITGRNDALATVREYKAVLHDIPEK